MAVQTNLTKLVDLAKEKSSERRRELLREVTDHFFEAPPESASPAFAEYDGVLSRLAADTAQDAREELARRFADAPEAPHGLVMQLARDVIEVAAPILQKSTALTEADLLAIAEESGGSHLKAISERETVSAAVSDTLVRRGDDEVVATLVKNRGANISRKAFETITERAETNPDLHAPLVDRQEMPADLLNDLMTVVETRLRDRILQRFDEIDPEELQKAIDASHSRLEARMSNDKDVDEGKRYINAMKLRRQLDGALLIRLLRENQMVRCAAGLAALAEVDFMTARRALESPSIDPLCLVCRAGGLDRTLFVTLAVLRNAGKGDALRDAKEFGRIFDELSEHEAQRAMRFMMLRKNAKAA
ncbi:DUF2336 domain-containing protein [Hyphobacterium sp. HN65]|uniref:DUF2336 domain-containing protein n=1 Tax=Hyphobacterium lacteum TaxID=3116575 RepID=A0ABU7LT26_9PROT|nr:DUF2336 domain-containing protein [Hyphobacterium sp. HN65]MEE2527047.1 DUF2336 domain-containing protein [Hyphobacterium sp. HN65]